MFIKDMMNEELQNSIRIRKDYERAMEKLPKGSLVRKVIKGREYYYLAFRDHGKVHFDYLGKLDRSEIVKFREAREYRARYRKKMSEIDQQIKFIRRALRGNGSA